MRILIAGASGAIGRPLVRRLRANQHEVFALTQSHDSAPALKENGAEPVIANALGGAAVKAAVGRIRPDAVINELTSLPRHYTPAEMKAAAERDRKVRVEGNINLLAALRDAGVRRYLLQSSGFWYAPGPGLADEFVPFISRSGATAAALECPPGAYNIVDGNPSPQHLWLTAFARAAGAPAPPRVSEAEALRTSGPDAVYYATRLRGASNEKARRRLEFRPRTLEWITHAAVPLS